MKNQTVNLFIIALTLGCFALSQQARAFCQQGCDLSDGNTFLGNDALVNNTTGDANTAIGSDALYTNTTGGANTASGKAALYNNTTGSHNTATGWDTLPYNTTGNFNTATGAGALYGNNGNSNTATGYGALNYNYSGDNNTAIGSGALYINTTGSNNTAFGANAGGSTIGSNNTAVGAGAGGNLTSGDNNIDIGNPGAAGEGNTIRIGTVGTQTTTYIAGIYGVNIAHGLGLVVDSSGHVGTKGSSERFKEKIKPMDKTSEALLALKPVIYRYKKQIDPEGTPQFGLVAEDVEKINPDLVARDAKGKVYTVRYDAVNAMLLNEFLKEHRKVQKLEAMVTQQQAMKSVQQKEIDSLKAMLKQQAAQIQKVSAAVELSKAARRLVANERR